MAATAEIAAWQAQGALDHATQIVMRCVRRRDALPNDDRRKPDAERAVRRALAAYHVVAEAE